MVRPDVAIVFFNTAISASLINSVVTFGIGSCQINSSVGTSVPKYLAIGPISRCVNLNQARANASAKAVGFSKKCLEIFA